MLHVHVLKNLPSAQFNALSSHEPQYCLEWLFPNVIPHLLRQLCPRPLQCHPLCLNYYLDQINHEQPIIHLTNMLIIDSHRDAPHLCGYLLATVMPYISVVIYFHGMKSGQYAPECWET